MIKQRQKKRPHDYLLAILKLNTDNSISFKGTGFGVSSNGFFYSAAHVFKNGDYIKEFFFCAVPSDDSVLYPITHLETKYRDSDEFKGPVYNDIAIGKINKGFKNFAVLKQKRPLLGDSQTIIGYRNTKLGKNRFIINENGRTDLSDIKIEIVDSRIENRFAVISLNKQDFDKPFELVENAKKFNNCFTLRFAAHHGVSGGPVLNENGSVSGIYFGGPENHKISHCIASKYSKKTTKKMSNLKIK